MDVENYFSAISYPIPVHTNPAEFLLDIVSSDFTHTKELVGDRVQFIQTSWAESSEAVVITRQISERNTSVEKNASKGSVEDMARPGGLSITAALLHRSWIKSYRDIVAYGIRIVMYLGKAIICFASLQRLM
jgi:hypothetical protein